MGALGPSHEAAKGHGSSFLLLAMPPSGAIMRAAHERKQMLHGLLASNGYSFGFTKYPDDWERAQLEELRWKLPSKRKPQAEAVV